MNEGDSLRKISTPVRSNDKHSIISFLKKKEFNSEFSSKNYQFQIAQIMLI